jgi:hypothetical protein
MDACPITGASHGFIAMPAPEYHRHEAVGHSALLHILRSPAHYRALTEQPPEPTPAMTFGSAVHAALLEPESFDARFAVAPEFDRRTKDGRAAAAEWEAANAGKTPLTETQRAAIDRIIASVRAHAGAARLLSRGAAELSAFWRDEETGIQCKCRPDYVHGWPTEPRTLVDLKTTQNASSAAFAKTIATLGYDVQAAFYVDGAQRLLHRHVNFVFVVVEVTPPYAAACYEASHSLLAVGRAKYRAALRLLQWCREHDRWPAYQPDGEIEEIYLPGWATAGIDTE